LGAFRAKEKRDKLIADHALLRSGFARLQERAKSLEQAERAAHAQVIAAREPIIEAELSRLAGELAETEQEAARLRAMLLGFSLCLDTQPTSTEKIRQAIDRIRGIPSQNRDNGEDKPPQQPPRPFGWGLGVLIFPARR
jgi:hypothetical protein